MPPGNAARQHRVSHHLPGEGIDPCPLEGFRVDRRTPVDEPHFPGSVARRRQLDPLAVEVKAHRVTECEHRQRVSRVTRLLDHRVQRHRRLITQTPLRAPINQHILGAEVLLAAV